MGDRKSDAEIPPLISDPIKLAEREASNALEQFDWAMEEVERWIVAKGPHLKISMLLALHRKAMDGVDQFAGNFRPAGVAIRGSKHAPVSADDVPRYVEEMLDYIGENWNKRTAVHLASYVMWRLNWIHPFADGNGRTSRVLSYMVLCGALGQKLPGTRTIPEQISLNKQPYYEALEAADFASRKGGVDVGEMERLMEGYLANQLVGLHEQATGTPYEGTDAGDASGSGGPARKNRLVRAIEEHPVVAGGVFLLIGTIITVVFT